MKTFPKKSMKEQRDHDIYVLASKLEEEFVCVSRSASPEVWYIDNGAFAHMTGVQECFFRLLRGANELKITMGNKEKCTPIGRGTVVFQMEARNKLRATNVLHVPGLG